jgi:guanylate kinase
MYKKNLIVLSSPSGGGKSTIAKYLLKNYPHLKFSVSCTTRIQRPKEIEGLDYYFVTKTEFENKVNKNEFAEYEEFFGNMYGTLKSEINNIINEGKCVLFDLDVKGALSLKMAYPDDALLVFIAPPSMEILEQRLKNRGTETQEQIDKRLERADLEMKMSKQFDSIIINDILENSFKKIDKIANENLIL